MTGTNGKTSVASFTRQILGGPGRDGGELRHRRRRGRGGGAALAHDARADHAAPAAGGPRRQGRDPRGDGGLEPRARPAPAGRGAPGGGGLHQHHPRPPRLSRRLRGVFRGEARRSSSGCCRGRARRWSTSTTRTGRGCGAIAKARGQRLHHRRPGRGLRPAADRPALRRHRAGAAVRLGRAQPQGAARADRRLPGAERAGGGRARHRLGQRPGGGDRRAAGPAHRARADGAGGDAGERRGGLRRLCPHAGRADHGADGAAPARDGAADRGLRRRRRPRPRQAAADGRGGGGGGGRGLSSPTTTRAPRTRRRSARRCAPARRRRPRSATGPRRS